MVVRRWRLKLALWWNPSECTMTKSHSEWKVSRLHIHRGKWESLPTFLWQLLSSGLFVGNFVLSKGKGKGSKTGLIEGKKVEMVKGKRARLMKGKRTGLIKSKGTGLVEGKRVGPIKGKGAKLIVSKRVRLIAGKGTKLIVGKGAGLIEGASDWKCCLHQ